MRGPDSYRMARKALDMMIQHKVWPTPQNYEIWLSYVGDPSSNLAREIDRLASSGETFTDTVCEALAVRFLPRANLSGALKDAGDQLSRELDMVSKAIKAAHLSTEAYGETLADAGAELQTAAPGELRKLVAGLTDATRKAESQTRQLQRQLEESTTEMAKLRDHLAEVRRDAVTDALTGLGNRKAFNDALEQAAVLSESTGKPTSLAVLDIDHFKRFNDTWGHQTGDQVLRYVSSVLGRVCDEEPRFAARYGGEEFAMIFPGESAGQVQALMQEVLEEIASRSLRRRSTNEELGSITVSIGLAEMKHNESLADFIERADSALYASKHGGRNRLTNAGKALVEAA
ncbi:MAG TPA: diguanylate cyclase [Caulobacteraceae bacterium]|jgi:diguanylate cyclase